MRFTDDKGTRELTHDRQRPGKKGNTSSVHFFTDPNGTRYAYKMATITPENLHEVTKTTILHQTYGSTDDMITPFTAGKTKRAKDGQVVEILTSIETASQLPSLSDLCPKNTPLPYDLFLKVQQGAHTAIQRMHGLGISHWDLNPGNLLIDQQTGAVILIDFGKALAPDVKTFSEPTFCTSVLPPEFFGQDISFFKDTATAIDRLSPEEQHAYDWWALGMTLLEATLGFMVTKVGASQDSRYFAAPDFGLSRKDVDDKLSLFTTNNMPQMAASYFLGLALTNPSPAHSPRHTIFTLIEKHRPDLLPQQRDHLSTILAEYLCPLEKRLEAMRTRNGDTPIEGSVKISDV